MNWLLAFIPVGIGLDWFEANPILVFLASALAIVPLAKLMGDATEVLAESLGATLGGLLNATLGNAPEIIISLFALHRGLVDVVKASVTGSIIGNLLFGLGLAMFAGGLKHRDGPQHFDSSVARMDGGLLFLATFGLVIPAIFSRTTQVAEQGQKAAEISMPIAVLLLFIYFASFLFTLLNSKPTLNQPKERLELKTEGNPMVPESAGEEEAETATWSQGKALGILGAVTVGLAIMSEILTGALEPTTESLGLTPLFAGVFLLALVGNAAELFSAVKFARKDQLDVSLGITVGASIQVSLVVVPLLVFFGAAFGQPMNLVFSTFELVAIILSVMVSRNLIVDGQSTWLEGLTLMVVYFMLGVGFYFAPVPVVAG